MHENSILLPMYIYTVFVLTIVYTVITRGHEYFKVIIVNISTMRIIIIIVYNYHITAV